MTEKFGKIQIYTGNGKGKTTASLGLAIRAFGRGRKVIIIYFDKGGDHYGERRVLDKLGLEYHACGLKRFDEIKKKFRFGVIEDDIKEAQRGLKLVKQIFQDQAADLLILDEIHPTIHLDMLKLEEVIEVIKQKPLEMELVMTGRGAKDELIDLADLVTEMKPIKHYFDQGQLAREGIEY